MAKVGSRSLVGRVMVERENEQSMRDGWEEWRWLGMWMERSSCFI